MRLVNPLVWLLVFAAPAADAADTYLAEPFTVEQAVATALAQNRSLAAAALAVDRAEQSLAAARAEALPRLEIGVRSGRLLSPVEIRFGRGDLGELPGAGPVPAEAVTVESNTDLFTQGSATLSQPLTQLVKVGLAVKLRRAERDSTTLELAGSRQAVTRAVKALFARLVASEGELSACRESLTAVRELERVVAGRVSREAALQADLLDVQARLAAELARERALEAALADQRGRFNDLLGRPSDSPVELEGLPVHPALPPLETLLQRALSSRPELAQAELGKRRAELGEKLERAGRIPDLSLSLSATAFEGVEFLPERITQIGLAFSWQPFDFGRSHRLEEARLAVTQARIAADDQAAQVRLEVAAAAQRVESARLELAAHRQAATAARERRRVEAARYAGEVSLFQDLLDAEAELAAAAAASWRAEAELAIAFADLELGVGASLGDLP